MKSTSPPPASRSAGIFEDFKASPRARRTPSVRTPSDYVISGKRRSHYEKAIAAARTVGTRRKERASFGSPPHKRASAKAPPVSTLRLDTPFYAATASRGGGPGGNSHSMVETQQRKH